MHTKLNDWKNGWCGIELSLRPHEIDRLIAQLESIKEDPDQHFHLSSDYKGAGGVGDIEISIQGPETASNMQVGSLAISPGSRFDEKNA